MAQTKQAASRRRVTFLVLGALAIGELVIGAWILWAGSVHHKAIALVPDDAALYVHAFVNPSRAQKRSLQRLLGKIPRFDTEDEAENAIATVLDSVAGRVGLSYEDDVEPWAGRELAFFVAEDGGAAFLVETNDEDDALAAVDTARAEAGIDVVRSDSVGDVAYEVDERGVAAAATGGFLIVGDQGGVETALSVDDGPSLASSDAYEAATDPLARDRILLAYVDPAALGRSGRLPADVVPPADAAPFALIAYVTPDGITAEASLPASSFTAGAHSLERLPAETWLALAFGDVDDVLDAAEFLPDITSALDQAEAALQVPLRSDLQNWGREIALFVTGDTLFDVAPGVVVTSHRSAPAAVTIEALGRALERIGPGSVERTTELEFSVALPALPGGVGVGLRGESVGAVYGRRAGDVLEPSLSLGADSAFRRAREGLGGAYSPYLYFDIARGGPLVNVALQTWMGLDVDDVLEGFSFAIGGLRHTDGRVLHKIVVGVEETH